MACFQACAGSSSCAPPTAASLEFVILISREDDEDSAKGCCRWLFPSKICERWCHCSFKDRLSKLAGGLQGVLHLALEGKDHCLRCNTPFTLDVMSVTPHVLYAKLPKEQTYVQEWETDYLISQMDELGYIFYRLGARKVRIKCRESEQDATKCSVGAVIDACTLAWTGSTKSGKVFETERIKVFKPAKKPVRTLEELLRDPKIYYLHKNTRWKIFVASRLNSTTESDTFKCDRERLLAVSRGIAAKFKKLGVEVTAEHSTEAVVTMEFSVEFGETAQEEKLPWFKPWGWFNLTLGAGKAVGGTSVPMTGPMGAPAATTYTIPAEARNDIVVDAVMKGMARCTDEDGERVYAIDA